MKTTILTFLMFTFTTFAFAQSELLTNGDFEDGRAPWTDSAGEIRTEGENSFFFADVATAGDAFAVNLSQAGLEIIQDSVYTLTFNASTSEGNSRTMIAGIGLNEAPFTAATETITLTENDSTYTVVLQANFGSADGRVLFDMGAEVGIVVLDNVSLVQGGETPEEPEGPSPEVAAPTPPERNAEDVISLFSNAYDNISVDTWSADFDDSDIEDVVIDGNDTKKITFGNFIGVDFASNPFDASEMTHFHIDFWTPETDLVGKVFNSKWSNHANGDGETNAYDFTYELTGDETGQWVSIDIPLAEANIVTNADANAFAQFLITSNLDVVHVDNIYLYKETSTSIEDGTEVPEGFALNQNYPNPFNPTTNISFNIPDNGEVTLEVFNIQGQRVATLVDGFRSAGEYSVTFDASNMASGVYTYRLSTENSVQVKRMVLIK